MCLCLCDLRVVVHMQFVFLAPSPRTDPNLLMSAAKDNQTYLWDLKSRAPTYTLPDVAPAGGSESFDLLAGAGGKRFDVQWSRHLPGLLCACSFSRKVQFFNLTAASSTYAPKWLRPSVGATTAFGGKLVTFKPPAPGMRPAVSVSTVQSDPAFAMAAERFYLAMQREDYADICVANIAGAEHPAHPNPRHKREWDFIKVLFAEDSRTSLLTQLGYDAAAVEAEAAAFNPPAGMGWAEFLAQRAAAKAAAAGESKGSEDDATPEAEDGDDDNNAGEDAAAATPAPATAAVAEIEDEVAFKRAVLVGNFDAAVSYCLSRERFADALLLATCCPDQSIWGRTVDAYFACQKRPFMNVVAAVMKVCSATQRAAH